MGFCRFSLPYLKRAFDVVLSVCLIVCFFWLFLVVGVLVKMSSPGPFIFWSKRVGRDGCIFAMPKFRTMRTDAPVVATDLLAESDRYITPVGSFLRKSSLDELPQIFSVLMGDMSFVGPRPALETQLQLTEKRLRHGVLSVRPGITGWAQINGRDTLCDAEKVEMDCYYIANRSFSFDFMILVRTLVKVTGDRDVHH